MTSGIYCEVPLGTIYEEKVLGRVHSRMRKLIGTSAGVPTQDSLTQTIVNYWYNKVSRRMSKILSSWKPPANRGFYNRTVDLTRSICLGIYYRGKIRRTYRFTGGSSEKTPWQNGEKHPDPAARAQAFLNDYELLYKTGFSIVIAATMPYAVILESKKNIPVLSMVVNRMLTEVYEFKQSAALSDMLKSSPIYGYIFE